MAYLIEAFCYFDVTNIFSVILIIQQKPTWIVFWCKFNHNFQPGLEKQSTDTVVKKEWHNSTFFNIKVQKNEESK